MKILFYQWKAYLFEDVYQTLLSMGHEVTLLNEQLKNIEEDAAYTEMLRSRLMEESFDFLFSINFSPVLATACHDADTLYVSWSCDSPLLAMYHEAIFYPTNVIFLFDQSNVAEFKRLGVTNLHHLPLAVHTERLSAQIACREKIYPVSFVGNLYEHNSFDEIAPNLPPYLYGYLECAMEAQLRVSGGNLLEELLTEEICGMLEELTDYHQSEKSFAGIKALFANTVLGFKTASLKRIRSLGALAYFLKQDNMVPQPAVHLFTESTAQELPGVCLHPPVDYLKEMPQIFHDSAVNLNFTIPGIRTGIPLRVWDILGSGGFALTNYQPELEQYFTFGKELDVFEDTGELLEKAAFYLKHEELRQKIAGQGQQLVSREHNYGVRLKELFAVLKQYLF